jgi:hypothetical protein
MSSANFRRVAEPVDLGFRINFLADAVEAAVER